MAYDRRAAAAREWRTLSHLMNTHIPGDPPPELLRIVARYGPLIDRGLDRQLQAALEAGDDQPAALGHMAELVESLAPAERCPLCGNLR